MVAEKAWKNVDLSVDIAGLKMKNPFTVASGTFASGKEYADLWAATLTANSKCQSPDCDRIRIERLIALGLSEEKPLSIMGAVTTKGVSHKPWSGNDGVRITETSSGMLNSIGLQNPGVEEFCSKDIPWLASQDVPVIVNVSGHSVIEYTEVIKCLELEDAVSAYEVNISCPNVDCGGMSFGTDTKAANDVVTACRGITKRPLIVKLTPNVTDITEIARACEAGGADALSMINTVAGMAIDYHTRKPLFNRKVAGLSGPAIKPVALYAVNRVHAVVKVPIIGMGGISCAEDVFEFLLAGASAVAIGSMNFSDPLSIPNILSDFIDLCVCEGVSDIKELIGGLK